MIRGVAVNGFPFTIRNTTTGEYITTGAIAGYVTLDDGAQAALTATPTYKGNGQWTVDLTAAETDGATIGLVFVHASGSQAFTILTQSAEEASARTVQHETDLLNDALGQIGEVPITAMDDGSVNATWCLTFYPALRDSLLREHPWKFATDRVQLAQDVTGPAFGWTYSYSLPSDYLKLQEYVGGTGATATTVFVSDGQVVPTYTIEGRKLLSDDATVYIKYTKRVANPALWDPQFYQAVATFLAAKLAGAIPRNAALEREKMDLALNVLLPTAKAVDGQEIPALTFIADSLTWGR